MVNLAAGLDARPYRLPLPATLHWIEVNLPDLLREKVDALGVRDPACRVDRFSFDFGRRRKAPRLFCAKSDRVAQRAHHERGPAGVLTALSRRRSGYRLARPEFISSLGSQPCNTGSRGKDKSSVASRTAAGAHPLSVCAGRRNNILPALRMAGGRIPCAVRELDSYQANDGSDVDFSSLRAPRAEASR